MTTPLRLLGVIAGLLAFSPAAAAYCASPNPPVCVDDENGDGALDTAWVGAGGNVVVVSAGESASSTFILGDATGETRAWATPERSFAAASGGSPLAGASASAYATDHDRSDPVDSALVTSRAHAAGRAAGAGVAYSDANADAPLGTVSYGVVLPS